MAISAGDTPTDGLSSPRFPADSPAPASPQRAAVGPAGGSEDWGRWEWEVVALRAERQLARVAVLCASTRRSLDSAALRNMSRLWPDPEQQRHHWHVSNKLLKKSALLGILLEVLDAQERKRPTEVPPVRRRVVAAQKEVDDIQQQLFERLVMSSRAKVAQGQPGASRPG
eukprot:TRINITY_DN72901_c0_g1_i1.p1 TRINITY_DN72901_c0_g1~~TRINITY_DN72901_c0_g1_i1.p1  ORF type:complete len:200 (+),score=45.27 TRINITY_DN72901_c0_g1_i1:92-601(+)